ncbi:uncharacterized protein Z518_09031 [Rhinocladiella mackenziei CBS 650.93]|uniref:EKC/KEOPS complex subunit BUD32 n=1 Tax=Rhinocladiella mackenziei CBS 650.93 TaxID=1442369 RepID=A0A0D2IDJ5_9EURO|nr:uncharacterized protein Z518_09031 [Rhinocladiella mackenziei CBS 650.93]KIX01306.1 hypothetical protein Z518_09031 [Rhinocladiella mackenziei CBS 650.93]
MPFLGKRSKSREVDLGLLVRIRKELQSKYSRPESLETVFIHPHDARSVVTRERVKELLKPFKWYHEDDRTELWRTMSLILCILITIEWTEWSEFKTYFAPRGDYLRYPRYTDDDLPLRDVSFLPPNIQDDFKREQYLFKPIVIEQNSHEEYSQRYRLPITKSEPIDDVGSQRDLDKIYLEKGYLYCTDQHNAGGFNSEVHVMARKRVAMKSQRPRPKFESDRIHLEQFRKSLQNHQNIMQSFASFVHGPDFVILTPWAAGRDLQKFLYSPEEILDNFPERSSRFTPHNVLIEAYSLAQGLDFIHNHMITDKGRRIRCGHVDLTPENILVCFPTTGSGAAAPVGRWKIVDFGISNVEESVAGSQIVQLPPAEQCGAVAPGTILRDVALQPFKTGPGAFQPPEVKNQQTAKVNTRRDVWSFGCVLAMILAFAIGGPEEVNAQLLCRSKGADDYFYHRVRHLNDTAQRQHPDSKHAEIKPAVKYWLEEKAPSIAPQMQRDWIRYCAKLVLRLLTINVYERPEMNYAVQELERILMWTEVYGNDRIWHFDGASTAPEVVSDVPEVNYPRSSMDSTAQPFIGVPSLTISSSGPLSATLKSGSTKGSRSIFFKQDGSLSFIRLEIPPNCDGGTLSPSAGTAALWSKSDVYIYDLGFLGDESESWNDTPRCEELKAASLKSYFSNAVVVPHPAKCIKVLLAGSFLAVVQQQHPKSTYLVRLLQRISERQNKIHQYRTIQLSSKPQDVKLSRKGFCLIQTPDKLELFTPRYGSH